MRACIFDSSMFSFANFPSVVFEGGNRARGTAESVRLQVTTQWAAIYRLKLIGRKHDAVRIRVMTIRSRRKQ